MDFPVTVNSQEEFDELVKGRLAREKDRWEKETNVSEYRDRAEQAEARAFGRLVDRDAREVLKSMNVPAERHGRILKFAELPTTPGEDGEPDRKSIIESFKGLHSDMPEVFGAEATVKETALDTSTGDADQDAPLTRERIETMSPDEINEPTMWERVQRFMAGERG
jgi:hypothetical protein